ncbi:hypothetical protein [Ensifer sp.]|uniref:hypothetical protein n=1 Tax=Ensifer sp. TaxID=1872086 RepID=UPI002E116F68|nr:hypothetical protein [Ensifer sp.]
MGTAKRRVRRSDNKHTGTHMRGTFFAMALATTLTFACGSAAEAGNYSYGGRQTCVVKTVKTYGAYGKIILKKVRICK